MPAIKAEVLFGVYKVFLIIRCSNAVWFLHSTPGSWEGIDLHRDCTYSALSKGNEAQQTAIFFRDVFLCLSVFVWVFFFFFWLFGMLKLMVERDCTASTGCLTVIINYLLNVMACLTVRSLSSGFVAMLKWVHSSPPPPRCWRAVKSFVSPCDQLAGFRAVMSPTTSTPGSTLRVEACPPHLTCPSTGAPPWEERTASDAVTCSCCRRETRRRWGVVPLSFKHTSTYMQGPAATVIGITLLAEHQQGLLRLVYIERIASSHSTPHCYFGSVARS